MAGTSAFAVGGSLPPASHAAAPSPGGGPVGVAGFDRASFDARFRHHTAVVNGVRLHDVIGGQGDPLVLLHGWPQTWYEWRHVMPALAERFTVIAPDLRGLEDSSKPLTGYDARTAAGDVRELVRQLGFSRIFLAGHDIGGWVAYAYAAAWRDEVRRLAILEILPAGDPILSFTALDPHASLWHFNFHFVRDLPEALVAGRERLYPSWFYRYEAHDPTAVDEELSTSTSAATRRRSGCELASSTTERSSKTSRRYDRALALGPTSVVAPLATSGAAVPVVAGFAGGDPPGPVTLLGLTAVMLGMVQALLASRPQAAEPTPAPAPACQGARRLEELTAPVPRRWRP